MSQETEKGYQEAQEARIACKELLRFAHKFKDNENASCQSAHEMSAQLDSMVVSQWIKHSPNIDVAKYLRYLSTTFKAVNSVHLKMVSGMENQVVSPLENFISYDFLEVQEVKKKVQNLASDYETCRGKIEVSLKDKSRRHKSLKVTDVAEYEKDLEKLKVEQDASTIQLSNLVEELHQKKETKLLRYMFNLLELQYEYHQKAMKLLMNLRPKMDALKAELEESENQMKGAKEGHLMQKASGGWQKNFFVLKGGYLSCYKGKKDAQTLDISLNVMLCTTRVPPKSKEGFIFEIISPDLKKPITLQSDTAKDRDDWIHAIQGAIEYSLNQIDSQRGSKPVKSADGDELAFKILKRIPGNQFCADCGAPDPDWASINLGVLVCLECSGVHRGLGTHITKVRSATLDTKAWEPPLLQFMKQMGNKKFNEFYEHKYDPEYEKPTSTSDRAAKEKFIKAKYMMKLFCDLPTPLPDRSTLSYDLYTLVATTEDDDVLGVLKLIASGADLEWQNAEDELKTVVHSAVIYDRNIYLEMLIQNGASIFSMESRQWTPMHYAAYYNRVTAAAILYKHGYGARQLELKDWQNKTAIELALNHQADDIVNVLRGEMVSSGVKIQDLYDAEEEEIINEIIDSTVDNDHHTTHSDDTSDSPIITPTPSPTPNNNNNNSNSGDAKSKLAEVLSQNMRQHQQQQQEGEGETSESQKPRSRILSTPSSGGLPTVPVRGPQRTNTQVAPPPSLSSSQTLHSTPNIPIAIAQLYNQPLPSLPTPSSAGTQPSPVSRVPARKPVIPPKPSFHPGSTS